MENIWTFKTELFVTFQCYRNEIKWTHWLSFAYPLARSLVWSLFLEKERKRLLGYRFSFGTIQRRLPWPLRKDDTQIRVRSKFFQGGAVASWLVRSSPDRAVWVRALVGDIMLYSWAILSWCPYSTQVYTAVKGCPTKAYERTRHCRKVLWVMMANCGLIKAKGVSAW